MRDARFQCQAQSLVIHIGDHEYVAALLFACHANDEAVAVEFRRKALAFFNVLLGAARGKGRGGHGVCGLFEKVMGIGALSAPV